MASEQSQPQTLAQAMSQIESQNASLAERLKAYREHSTRLRPDAAKAYDAIVERLDNLERGEIGPGVGEPMPDFTLPDENGNLVSLSSLLKLGPAVISINRGHWCPYCRLELRALAARYDEITAAGAQIVSIMPDVSEFTGSYRSRNALPFRILSDVDLGYSLLLGLVFWIGNDIKTLYDELGVDLGRYQGNRSYFLPIAAKFIVDQSGTVRAREVNVEFRQRMDPDAIVAALRSL